MILAKRSLKGPIALFVTATLLVVTLTVLWNIALVGETASSTLRTAFLVLGTALFVLVLVMLTLLAVRAIVEHVWRRRQEAFLASVSHELNSPLQAIKLHARTLAKPDVDPQDRERFLTMMIEDVDRLSALVGNLLAAARIDQRRLPVDRERVDLGDVLEAWIERTRAARPEADLHLLLEVDGFVDLDRGLFRQVLDNLVDNSIKYSKGRPHIEVRLGAEAGSLVLEVTDRGIGLPADEHEKIFERFHRVRDGDPERSEQGAGLGLGIVRAICEAHGWRVEADSPGPGRGTTVQIRIPDYDPVDFPDKTRRSP